MATRVAAAPLPARLALSTVLWAFAACIVLVWRIGPVVATLTETHGVHSGDLFAIPIVAAGALVCALRPSPTT